MNIQQIKEAITKKIDEAEAKCEEFAGKDSQAFWYWEGVANGLRAALIAVFEMEQP